MSMNEITSPASQALPEPNFIDRDVDAITREWIALYEEKTGKTLQPAQIERLLIDVGVYRENLLRIAIQQTAKQNLVNFATYPVLDYLGELVGVKRLSADYAGSTIRFTLTEAMSVDITVPSGAQIETKDGKIIFVTTSDAVIKAGSLYVDVDATANTAGISGNGYLTGEINNLITPISYINSALNINESSGGADEETDDQLRERIKEAPEQFSNAGSKGAYRFHTMSAHASIIDVAVMNKQAGIVEIYPLTKDGTPSDEVLTTVQSYLNAEKIRPLTDQVIVSAPEKVDYTITAELTLYNFADKDDVEAQAQANLDDYISILKSKLGKDIVPTQIIAILNSIYGVYKVELTSPLYLELDTSQWANCTGCTITIGGFTDG